MVAEIKIIGDISGMFSIFSLFIRTLFIRTSLLIPINSIYLKVRSTLSGEKGS